MSFVTTADVRFAHVDSAAIVFYPRYFEMLNAAVEDFFAAIVGVDFATLHVGRALGVPTVSVESRFLKPSRLGDRLEIAVTVERVGRSACTLSFEIRCGGELRMTARNVLVCMALKTASAQPWPDDIRARLDHACEPLATDRNAVIA